MKKKILIVDDEPQINRMLNIRMQANGYDTLSAFDGEQALEEARVNHPDLIILDVMMPKMDGFEVCRRLKQDTALKDIPVVMLSVKVDEGARDWAAVSGADDYLAKPFEAAELLEKIKKLLK
jgi:DNA-binding response OmpR family regulator